MNLFVHVGVLFDMLHPDLQAMVQEIQKRGNEGRGILGEPPGDEGVCPCFPHDFLHSLFFGRADEWDMQLPPDWAAQKGWRWWETENFIKHFYERGGNGVWLLVEMLCHSGATFHPKLEESELPLLVASELCQKCREAGPFLLKWLTIRLKTIDHELET